MNAKSELNWQNWMIQGDQYLNASTPKNEKSRFGTGIVYNLLSMSLESYIMAMLDVHGTLPDNHTYTDLFNALDTVMEIEPDLKKRILNYENIQSICSIDKFSIKEPTHEEILDLHGALIEFSELAHLTCKKEA